MKIGTFSNVKTKRCQYCNIEFKNVNGSYFANHVRWCKSNPLIDIELEKNKGIKFANITNTQKYGIKQYYIVQCFKCGCYFIIEKREKTYFKKRKFFCSRSCANTRPHTEEEKLKIKNSICKNGKTLSEYTKEIWKTQEYSKKVLSHNPCFTSKGERLIRDWFINSFPEEEWSYGGCLHYKEIKGIVRDLYSNKLKICIEYDGIWHFKDIVGQLKSKQDKDTALELWCLDNNYRLIRIKDDIFQKNPTFWINKIRNEIDNPTSQIVKFY